MQNLINKALVTVANKYARCFKARWHFHTNPTWLLRRKALFRLIYATLVCEGSLPLHELTTAEITTVQIRAYRWCEAHDLSENEFTYVIMVAYCMSVLIDDPLCWD